MKKLFKDVFKEVNKKIKEKGVVDAGKYLPTPIKKEISVFENTILDKIARKKFEQKLKLDTIANKSKNKRRK